MTALTLEVTPHPAFSGISALDYLAEFPYGCAEQTLNSFIPQAAYYTALQRLGYTVADTTPLEERMRKGLAKLERYQRSDGGFGWWKDAASDLYVTSLALLGVSRVGGMDPERHHRILSKAAAYVQKELLKPAVPDVLAFGLYALSEAGYRQPVLIRSLISNMNRMDALPLSLTALSLANHGMTEEARRAADLLCKRIQHGPEGAFFPEPDSHRNRLAVETTAYALTALLRITPEFADIDQILKWLVLQKTGRYWISTKSTGIVVSALSEYLKIRGEQIPFEDQTVSVRLNHGPVTAFTIKRSDYLKGKAPIISIPGKDLAGGSNALVIESEQDVYYALRVETFQARDAVAPQSQGCRMSLEKATLAVTRVHDSVGNPRVLSRPLEPGERLRVGDEIQIEIRFKPDRDYDYFILEDRLPSGFEVVDFQKEVDGLWWRFYTHKERRDDKAVFFFDRLEKDREVTVQYILRSELNGRFYLPYALLYGMYRPSVYAHSGSGQLAVGN